MLLSNPQFISWNNYVNDLELNPFPEGEEVRKSPSVRLLAYALSIVCTFTVVLAAAPSDSAEKLEKLRAAYPAVAPGSTPSWITAEKKIWQKYGIEVEPILVSGGARAVPALLGQSVHFLFGSDTGVTTAQLQGIPVVRLGVTMNTLGSSLLTQPSVQSVQDLKGKILGISRGRDASYIRLAKALCYFRRWTSSAGTRD
jgi:ABC-type nitrate/sulfonate/bicarbonate transport system substrate-binding protein